MSTDARTVLLRKVWITRKCRIEASERLLRRYNLYNSLLIYYSIIIVVYSIWNIQPSDTHGRITEASLFLMIVSVVFSLFSLFVSTKNLQEKYFNLKINYIELDKIHGQLSGCDPTNTNEITSIQAHYDNLLGAVDNHESIDYFRVILNTDERKELTKERLQEMQQYIKKSDTIQGILKIVLYTVPLLLPLVIKLFLFTINWMFPTN